MGTDKLIIRGTAVSSGVAQGGRLRARLLQTLVGAPPRDNRRG